MVYNHIQVIPHPREQRLYDDDGCFNWAPEREFYLTPDQPGSGFWRWRFSWVFSYKFCLRKLLQGRTAEKKLGLSTGCLADGKHAEELWPLNRLIEQRIPMGFDHRRCRIGRMRECALTGNSNVFSWWESGFELHIFPTWGFFPIIPVFRDF